MIQEWLSCPVCGGESQHEDDPRIIVALDHEHLVFQCSACETALKRFHGEFELFPSPGRSTIEL